MESSSYAGDGVEKKITPDQGAPAARGVGRICDRLEGPPRYVGTVAVPRKEAGERPNWVVEDLVERERERNLIFK